jgi:hypothetical protein
LVVRRKHARRAHTRARAHARTHTQRVREDEDEVAGGGGGGGGGVGGGDPANAGERSHQTEEAPCWISTKPPNPRSRRARGFSDTRPQNQYLFARAPADMTPPRERTIRSAPPLPLLLLLLSAAYCWLRPCTRLVSPWRLTTTTTTTMMRATNATCDDWATESGGRGGAGAGAGAGGGRGQGARGRR